jgi:DNA-3-methyladenine glycosylase II
MLGIIIAAQSVRWPSVPTEDPLWGLIRIVMAQQISTRLACRIAEHARSAHPSLTSPSAASTVDPNYLRLLGLTERRANCCITILQRSDRIRADVGRGKTWEDALAGISGIGPWTLSIFRIMVLRQADILPLDDVGLKKAVSRVYGAKCQIEQLSENWRPFRSVACWYLWRTLGNAQLG